MLQEQIIEEVVRRYRREFDRYDKMRRIIAARCETFIRTLSIQANVQSRTKSPSSLQKKLRKLFSEPKYRARFTSVDAVFAEIKDFAGVRITTYVESDRQRIADAVPDFFSGPSDKQVAVDVKDNTSHYRATHCVVALKHSECIDSLENLSDVKCEIQICSLLAHVFNELEHDIGYKPTGSLSHTEMECLAQLWMLLESGDRVIVNLIDSNKKRLASQDSEILDDETLVSFLETRFSDCKRINKNADKLLTLLSSLGLNRQSQISEEFLKADFESRSRKLFENLADYSGNKFKTPLYRLDIESSDRLLVLVLEKYAQQVLDKRTGKGRKSRNAILAQAWLDMMAGVPPHREVELDDPLPTDEESFQDRLQRAMQQASDALEYDNKGHSDQKVGNCIDCETLTAVIPDPVSGDWGTAHCFLCEKSFAVKECSRCGDFMSAENEDVNCSSCWSDVMNRD